MAQLLLVIFLLIHFLGLLSAFNALMTTRTSQGAIAWVLSLLTIPYIALPLYWFFGRSRFQGYTDARKEAQKLVAAMLPSIIAQLKAFTPDASSQQAIEKTFEQLVDTPYLQGNAIDLLIDGETTFQSILNAIETAQKYILLEFYIVRDDHLGKKIQNALIRRADAGIKIYFLYDEIGSYKLPQEYLERMRGSGIAVYDFHTQKGPKNRFQINFRNHRKIVVVDGVSAWIGGHNIGDEYLSKSKKFGHWRDTHIKITGPSAIAIQKSFTEDWFWATNSIIEHLVWQPQASEKENKKILIVASSPADTFETASLMFIQAINSAKKRIWISSPYFVPDSAVTKALQLAGLRGVDVRILIPNKADHILVYLAAFTYFEPIGLSGVKFFRYNDGFLHQKVMLIDDTHATVGTANLDNRSFRLNFEITALITDNSFSKEIEHMLEDDLRKSYEITLSSLAKKPFVFKLITRLARLSAPIL